MPGDLKFCQNCRKFTSKCSRDNSVCTTNVKRAMFDLREKEYWKILAQQRSLVIRAGWEERGIVTAAGSSMMGAAMTWEAQERIRETWESMQRARRLEMQAAKEDMKRREEELKRKEEELKRKERDLRKREEELWRRKDKVQMLEGKVRQREKEVRSREEIVKKGKRSEAGRRSGWEEIKRGFARCPCKTP
jgi:DNA repair exonuclease SbcCD ATPase subunit